MKIIGLKVKGKSVKKNYEITECTISNGRKLSCFCLCLLKQLIRPTAENVFRTTRATIPISKFQHSIHPEHYPFGYSKN